jgi:hypothetical protein
MAEEKHQTPDPKLCEKSDKLDTLYRGDPGFETECEEAKQEEWFWSPDNE